jgi:hypothetical protein
MDRIRAYLCQSVAGSLGLCAFLGNLRVRAALALELHERRDQRVDVGFLVGGGDLDAEAGVQPLSGDV